jgi:hypothetical protein
MSHPQEARKFVFASKLSRDQSCILVSITIPNFIDCKFFGDSDLENGLCRRNPRSNYHLGFKIDDQVSGGKGDCGWWLAGAQGSDGSLIVDNFGQSGLEPRIKLRKKR